MCAEQQPDKPEPPAEPREWAVRLYPNGHIWDGALGAKPDATRPVLVREVL